MQEQSNATVAATTKAYGECRSGSSHSTVVGIGGDRNDRNDLPESYNKELLPKRVIKKNEVYWVCQSLVRLDQSDSKIQLVRMTAGKRAAATFEFR